MSLQNSNPPLVPADGTHPTRDINTSVGSAGMDAAMNKDLPSPVAAPALGYLLSHRTYDADGNLINPPTSPSR